EDDWPRLPGCTAGRTMDGDSASERSTAGGRSCRSGGPSLCDRRYRHRSTRIQSRRDLRYAGRTVAIGAIISNSDTSSQRGCGRIEDLCCRGLSRCDQPFSSPSSFFKSIARESQRCRSRRLTSFQLLNGRPYSFEYSLIGGESQPAFARHNFIAHPNRKLPGVSPGSFHISAKLLLEQGRYTSGTWRVGRSSQTVSDNDFHARR